MSAPPFYYALVSADSFSGEGTDVLMFCHTKQHRAIWDVVLVFSVYARWLFCGFSYRAGNRSDRDSDVRDSWFLFLVGEDRSVGYVKSGVLDVFFLSWAMLPAALACSVPRKCSHDSIFRPFFGIVLHRIPPYLGKCRKTQFGGMKYVENRISAGKMLHDSKFAPKIGIVIAGITGAPHGASS